jgi:hypothetical protein
MNDPAKVVHVLFHWNFDFERLQCEKWLRPFLVWQQNTVLFYLIQVFFINAHFETSEVEKFSNE